MDADVIIIHEEERAALCAIQETEWLKEQTTIGRLLNELQMILYKEQEENPISEATTEFKKNLEIIEKAYKEEIPRIVQDYQKEYQQNFFRVQLPKVEDQYKKLVNWTDDIDNPGAILRKAITDLREKSYDEVETDLKAQWNCTREQFKNGKCCKDQAQALRKRAEEDFDHYKKFKEKVNGWFKDLEYIYKEAEALLDTENYKKLYAYRLEFSSILHEVRELKKDETKRLTPAPTPAKDHEWLKNMLTKCLSRYCIATYEYFYWHKNWVEITENEKKAREKYETFKASRRDNFIREAQDVELEEDAGCEVVEESKTHQQPGRVASKYYRE